MIGGRIGRKTSVARTWLLSSRFDRRLIATLSLFGGPDFVVEIASDYDRCREKFDFYAKLESASSCWLIADPWQLEFYRLTGSEAKPRRSDFRPSGASKLASKALPLDLRLILRLLARPQSKSSIRQRVNGGSLAIRVSLPRFPPASWADHFPRRRIHRLLPSRRPKAIAIFRPRVGEDDPAAVVHDRAEAIGVERGGTVLGRAALAPKPGIKNQVCGIACRSSASCSGYVAPTTAPDDARNRYCQSSAAASDST